MYKCGHLGIIPYGGKEMILFILQLLPYVLPLATAKSSAAGLKWVRVNVPQFKVPGESATLECDYDLGNFTLYALKWYKEHEEFYRYVPKARPQSNWYEVDGVHVSMSQSDSKRVTLHDVSWKTSGLFKCEVSAEAPSFASAQAESKMEVVYLPEEDPTITGVEMQYQIGDEINLNCTSGKSHPPSILHWYINEQQIQKPGALIQYPPKNHGMGLTSSTLGLRFKLGEHHFRGGSMKVKCIASIAPILYRGELESLVQKILIKDMREALLLVKSGCGSTTGIFSKKFIVMLILMITVTNWTLI